MDHAHHRLLPRGRGVFVDTSTDGCRFPRTVTLNIRERAVRLRHGRHAPARHDGQRGARRDPRCGRPVARSRGPVRGRRDRHPRLRGGGPRAVRPAHRRAGHGDVPRRPPPRPGGRRVRRHPSTRGAFARDHHVARLLRPRAARPRRRRRARLALPCAAVRRCRLRCRRDPHPGGQAAPRDRRARGRRARRRPLRRVRRLLVRRAAVPHAHPHRRRQRRRPPARPRDDDVRR